MIKVLAGINFIVIELYTIPFLALLETSDSGFRWANVSGGSTMVASSFKHFFSMHDFFFFPGPPNLGLSLQKLHDPQSVARHPVHSRHLLRLVPRVSN